VRWRKTEVASPFIGLERQYDVWSKEGIAWAAFIVSVLKDKGNRERGAMVRHGLFVRRTLYGL
jgi:hypothetical protein